MFFRRFYDESLAQASYLVGCDATREAIVVDANRDLAPYLAAAEDQGLRITQVTETHIHADFVSGSRELARRLGARLLLSGEGGRDWQYAYAREEGATLLRDRDALSVGRVRLDVLHTPGHTPEHLAFLVTDLAALDSPLGLLSGDFLFVGDVGRPDLLERAANMAGTMVDAAHALFRSLQRIRDLPDFVQVWPGHGAGSACGKALGAMPQSTIGYEKVANWGLTTRDEAAFVEGVLSGQPDPPAYFAEMKRVNRDGPALLGEWPRPGELEATTLTPDLLERTILVDTRPADLFAEAHLPGALNIPLNKSFLGWAGWLVPYDRDVHLIASDARQAERAARFLLLIGLDRVAGFFLPEAIDVWRRAGRAVQRVGQITGAGLAPRLAKRDAVVVDVRDDSEWALGHLPGALHIPLGRLASRAQELPHGTDVVVQCQGGNRSAIGASVLQRLGVATVANLCGGFSEWSREGRDVVRD